MEAVHGAPEKSIDELKKVTPCNRCGVKSRRFSREKSDGKGRGGTSNYPIVEVYNDGSKTQTSHMKVLFVMRFWIVVLARVCVERNLSLRWHRHVHERGKRVGDKRDTEAIGES